MWEGTVVKIPHKKIKSINKLQNLKNFPVPFLQGWKKNQSRRDSYINFIQRKRNMKEKRGREGGRANDYLQCKVSLLSSMYDNLN